MLGSEKSRKGNKGMYERIMRERKNEKFFALLEAVFPESSTSSRSSIESGYSAETDISDENEWMQEYHIIYNSYIEDGHLTD